MIGTSTWDYIHIQFWILILRHVVSLSFLYTASCVLAILFNQQVRRLPVPLEVWAVAETLFYFLIYLPRKFTLQQPASHPALFSPHEREELSNLCHQSISRPDEYLSKWFLGAPLSAIKRDNVKEFFRWGFFNADNVDVDDDAELEGYVSRIETNLLVPIEPGRGDVKCLRLTLDEVHTLHRSLMWYMAVFFVDSLGYFLMLYHKFDHYRIPLTRFFTVFPLRLQTLLSPHVSTSPTVSYFHRPHTSSTRLPVLFLHGIGIGLYPYVPFFSDLNEPLPGEEGEVGIIALEVMPVSFRITHAALAKDVMIRQIRTILRRHGWDRFVLVAHSYGSVIVTHLLRDPEVSSSIASLVLVDPVSILLHLPDVAYNFTRRKPRRANEHQLHYFASTDMGVAHTLGRHFFWSENITWKHELPRRTAVFLAGRDLIVDTAQVRAYLTEPGWEDAHYPRKGLPIDVRWCAELDHGQMFDFRSRRAELVRVLREHTRLEG